MKVLTSYHQEISEDSCERRAFNYIRENQKSNISRESGWRRRMK